MENDSADDDVTDAAQNRPVPYEKRLLESEIVEREGRRDNCTLYPPGAREEIPVTRWMSATGEAFVDLEDMR